jgi:NAD(P)-dependent dehydrogenase (short-subunit alcohol dehydrogenase family)
MRTNKELFDLSGQVAIVTGGASGIGVQIAYALGEAGADLVIASRKLANCKQLAEKMENELSVSVLPKKLDVTSPEDIDNFYNDVIREYGRVDILVNNSGATWAAPSFEYPLKGWKKVIDTNLTGSWLMAQKAGHIMSSQNYGRIINIASVAAFVGSPSELMDAVAYPASKAAIIGLTKDLAVKWARYNITVNAIAPGWFLTKMSQGKLDEMGDEMREFIPQRRFGGDDELKTAILFLAAKGSGYCTGVVVNVDGGSLAQ